MTITMDDVYKYISKLIIIMETFFHGIIFCLGPQPKFFESREIFRFAKLENYYL